MSTSDDVSLLAFDIGSKQHAWAGDRRGGITVGSVDNATEPLRALIKQRLGKGLHLRVLAEATGVYYLNAMLIARELGAEVMVINPRRAHHFAQACGQRNKTDKLDAKMLLECLRRMPFEAWEPPKKTWRQLREYGRFLVRLTDDSVAMQNRLHALRNTVDSPRFLHTELKRMIANNAKRIERVRAAAVTLIKADDYLKARFDAFITIKGVAETSAVSILSELIVLPPSLSGRACVSHSGLDPTLFESGTSVHKAPRISRHGNAYLRRALFHPALSAGSHDPGAMAFKARLLGRGKKKMQANAAIMRKTLTVCWAMMKDPQPYDFTKLYATQENAVNPT